MRIIAALERPGKGEACGIAGEGGAFDRGATGESKIEDFRCLVEGLAKGVVYGGADAVVLADRADIQRLGMAAGDEKEQIGRRHLIGQPGCQRVAFEVVYGD